MERALKNSLANDSVAKLYLKADIADVNFVFKQGRQMLQVPAHKTILASGSSVFRAMFFGSLPEDKLVKIVDASASEFQEFLQLFYLSSVTLTIKNMEAVIRLADKYDVSDALIACFADMENRLTDENVFWAYQWAVELNNEHIQQLCLKKCNGTFLTKKIFDSPEFLASSHSMLERILQAEITDCDEVSVFCACLAWSKSMCREKGLNDNSFANLKQQLGSCFYLIRFGAMSQEEIGKIMADKSDLFSRTELVELLSKDAASTTFSCQPRKNISYSANKNAEMVLMRRLHGGGAPKVRFPQSTFFSSDQHILLGAFTCASMETGARARNMPRNATFHFEILKYESIDRQAARSVVHKGGELKYRNYFCPIVELKENILIEPNKMYEIRCTSDENENVTYWIRNTWRDEGIKRLSSGAKITLHKNATNGIVASMRFKSI